MTFLTVVSLGSTAIQILVSHIWCILVKHFKYLWLQLDKEMKLFLAL